MSETREKFNTSTRDKPQLSATLSDSRKRHTTEGHSNSNKEDEVIVQRILTKHKVWILRNFEEFQSMMLAKKNAKRVVVFLLNSMSFAENFFKQISWVMIKNKLDNEFYFMQEKKNIKSFGKSPPFFYPSPCVAIFSNETKIHEGVIPPPEKLDQLLSRRLQEDEESVYDIERTSVVTGVSCYTVPERTDRESYNRVADLISQKEEIILIFLKTMLDKKSINGN